MDAAMPEVRMLIAMAYDFEGADGAHRALASQCGNLFRDTGISERYVAHVGEGAFGPFWKVVMDVKGDGVEIAWNESGMLPPPPSGTRDHLQRIEPVATTSRRLADVDDIRKTWLDEALWHPPQDATAFACHDGNPVFLEACVDGRYGARARNCSARAMAATDRLWRAFNEALPAPPKPEWRDARGHPATPPDPRD
jgi:hypothetical protein